MSCKSARAITSYVSYLVLETFLTQGTQQREADKIWCGVALPGENSAVTICHGFSFMNSRRV
jgi:hypothetical protein